MYPWTTCDHRPRSSCGHGKENTCTTYSLVQLQNKTTTKELPIETVWIDCPFFRVPTSYRKSFAKQKLGRFNHLEKRGTCLGKIDHIFDCKNRIREKMTQNTNPHSSVVVKYLQSIQLC